MSETLGPGMTMTQPPSVRPLLSSAVRGAGLIGLAVVIGVVLLQVIDTGSSGPVGNGGGLAAPIASNSDRTTTTTTTAPTGTTGTTAPPATEEPAVVAEKQPIELLVNVYNGVGTPGLAKALSSKLAAKGYKMGTPGDANQQRGSTVSCKEGLDREAKSLAAAVAATGRPATVVSFPTTVLQGSATANCIVIMGA